LIAEKRERRKKEGTLLKLKNILVATLLISMMACGLAMRPTVYSQGGPNGPRTDNLKIHIYLNPDAENYALEAGDLDINDWPLTKEWIDKWTGNAALQMDSYSEIGMMEFDLNNQRWPTGVTMPRVLDPATGTYKHYTGTSAWDDEATEFRKAIAYLTNKDMYISDILKGFGYRMDSVVPTPALAGYIPPDLPIYLYDPETAVDVLDAAGFTQGTTPNPYYDSEEPWSAHYIRTDPKEGGDLACLEFYIRIDDPNRMQAGIHLTDNLRKAGIPVCDHITEKSVCYEKAMVEYDYHIYTGGWSLSADLDSLYWLWSGEMYFGGTETSYYGGIGWSLNYPGYCSPAYDAAAGEILTAVTATEVKEACFDAQIVMAEDCPLVPLWCSAAVKAYDSGFEGVVNEEGFGIDNYWTFLNMYQAGDNTIDWGFKSNLEGPSVITSEWLWDWNVLGLIYDSLIGLNPYNFAEEYGWLAESWSTGSWAPGKMYAQFTIVPGAKFHDGSALTADDVKFSYEFTKACGPGVAWNYASVSDIDHVDILGPLEIRVCFTYESYWMLHWAGGLPIINEDLWMAANTKYGWGYGTPDWDPMKVRDYHLWNQDANENGIIDLCEDGSGAWKYDSTEKPAAIGASTWVLLTANRAYYKTQTEISDYLRMAFHAIGDIDYDGDIDILDLSLIARSLGTDDSYPWGTDWNEYNPDTDIYTCISWPEWVVGDGKVNVADLTTAAMNYGRISG
jgi:ABC-type transport system substrate-binding protein